MFAVRTLTLLTCLLLGSVQASSFDCARASSAVEKLVCASKELSALDSKLATAYEARKKTVGPRELSADQKRWLSGTRDRCKDTACLLKVYRARIHFLETWHDLELAGTALAGVYRQPTRVAVFDGRDWSEEDSEDCLSLEPGPEGTMFFSVFSVQSNAHTCQVSGQMRPKGSMLELVPGSLENQNEAPCQLQLRVEKGRLVLQDPLGECRDWCGARASLDGLQFVRARRKAGKVGECDPGY